MSTSPRIRSPTARAGLPASPGITFLSTDALNDPRHRNRYEVVVCMETLEHCPDDIQLTVLSQIHHVTSPDGTVVISVPIEVGPPLLAKQGARALLALGGRSEYATRERYQPSELVRMLFAGADTAIPREEFKGDLGSRFTGHKGFNWRRLERTIERRFAIERRLFSPLPRLGVWLNSQVWFVCRKPPTA